MSKEAIPVESLGQPRDSALEITPGELATRIETWLCRYLADLLDLQPHSVETSQAFARFGLDSASMIGMTGDLGAWLGCEIDEALVYDYPTISSLSQILAARPDVQRIVGERAGAVRTIAPAVSA
jgi:acyl carrier protein